MRRLTAGTARGAARLTISLSVKTDASRANTGAPIAFPNLHFGVRDHDVWIARDSSRGITAATNSGWTQRSTPEVGVELRSTTRTFVRYQVWRRVPPGEERRHDIGPEGRHQSRHSPQTAASYPAAQRAPSLEVRAQGQAIGWVEARHLGKGHTLFYFATGIHPESRREYRLEGTTMSG